MILEYDQSNTCQYCDAQKEQYIVSILVFGKVPKYFNDFASLRCLELGSFSLENLHCCFVIFTTLLKFSHVTVALILKLLFICLFILQIVHGNQSCSEHFISFLIQAYKRALPVYLPVYLIPALIVHRKGLLKRWLHLSYLISFLIWMISDIWGWNVWHFSFERNTIASESSVRKILDGSSIFFCLNHKSANVAYHYGYYQWETGTAAQVC